MNARGHLNEHVPYLLNRTGGRYALVFAQALRKAGVRFTNWRVLHTLWHRGPLLLSDIAQSANFDLSTLSRVIAGLEDDGLIERRPAAGRGQRRPVGLSAAGERLMDSLMPLDTTFEAQLVAGLSDGERTLLVELLNKMYGNLRTYDSESVVTIS